MWNKQKQIRIKKNDQQVFHISFTSIYIISAYSIVALILSLASFFAGISFAIGSGFACKGKLFYSRQMNITKESRNKMEIVMENAAPSALDCFKWSHSLFFYLQYNADWQAM